MNKRRIVLTLLLAIGASSCSYGVMFTMLDDFRNKFGISESGLGLIVGVGFFTSFVGQVSIAPLADRGRAQRLIIRGLGLEVIGCLGMAIGTSFTALFLSRVIMGLGAGTALPALRRVIIVADPENFGRNLGRILSFEVAGFAAGPIFSVLFAEFFGVPGPFVFLAAVISIFVLVISRIRVPETAKEHQPSERFAIDLLKDRAVASGILIGVALFFMIGVFDSLWVLMMDDLDAAQWMANLGVSVFVVPLIILGPFGGKFVQRVGPYRTGGFGMILGAIFMSGYGLMPTPWLMMIVFLFHSINDGFFVTAAGVAVGTSAPLERQAGAQGLLGGIETLAGGFAASFAGLAYDHFGRTTTFVGTGAIMLVLILFSRILAGDNWSVRNVVPKSAVPIDIVS
ncbi:MAG: MFS transporter [Actinobacteria bacterium]|nr:MFS transporter [Actinomycetota bacterium]